MSDVSVQHEHLIRRAYTNTRVTAVTVICDGGFFSPKVEQSSVLVDDAYCQIRNALCDDRQVSDLRRCFRYLISWCHVRGKFMYRMYAFIVALEVTLHSTRIMFTLIILTGKSDLYHFRGCNIRFEENSSSDPMLLGLLKFIL